MHEELHRLFEMMHNGGNKEEHFEPLAPLSKKEQDEWDRLHSNRARIKCMMEEADAKMQLFWSKIERKTKIYDKNMRIDNGMIMVEVDKKNNCHNPGEPHPGFCDEDCDNCALNPDKHGDE
jgi:hypothetical protein